MRGECRTKGITMAFDGEICIRLLLDQATPPADRLAAAESLMHYPKPQACDALFRVTMDESEEQGLREEAAGSLGILWCELGIQYERLADLPLLYLQEAVEAFSQHGVRIDLDQIGEAKAEFIRRINGNDLLKSLLDARRE